MFPAAPIYFRTAEFLRSGLKSWPIVNEPSQITLELKRWFASTPRVSGLLTTSSLALATVWCARFYQAEPAPVVGTAKHPVPLCLTSVLPPSERLDPSPARTLLPVFAPMGTCANPVDSPLLRFFTSFEESLQVATSPCYPRDLPDVMRRVFLQMPEPLPRRYR